MSVVLHLQTYKSPPQFLDMYTMFENHSNITFSNHLCAEISIVLKIKKNWFGRQNSNETFLQVFIYCVMFGKMHD